MELLAMICCEAILKENTFLEQLLFLQAKMYTKNTVPYLLETILKMLLTLSRLKVMFFFTLAIVVKIIIKL